jgi:hypothetical protein
MRDSQQIGQKLIKKEIFKHLFLDISSTNIDTLDPLLYQCAETHQKQETFLYEYPLHSPFAHKNDAFGSTRLKQSPF